MIVSRTAEGEYVAVEADVHPEDGEHEADALPVPTFIEGLSDDAAKTAAPSSGVRQVDR